MKKLITISILLLAALIMSSCSLISNPSPTATISMQPVEPLPTVALPTDAPLATALPTLQPTIEPSPTPFQGMQGVVMTDNLLLRSGPGFLLPSLGMYSEKEVVTVLGRTPGSSWLYVKTSDEKYGYMKLELVDLKGDFYELPEVEPDGFVIVRGHLYTPNGSPASHITMTLDPSNGTDVSQEDAATTDALGRFYFFLPEGSKGTWTLGASGYGCESSAVNSSCSLIGTFPPPQQITFTESPDVWFNIQILP